MAKAKFIKELEQTPPDETLVNPTLISNRGVSVSTCYKV